MILLYSASKGRAPSSIQEVIDWEKGIEPKNDVSPFESILRTDREHGPKFPVQYPLSGGEDLDQMSEEDPDRPILRRRFDETCLFEVSVAGEVQSFEQVDK